MCSKSIPLWKLYPQAFFSFFLIENSNILMLKLRDLTATYLLGSDFQNSYCLVFHSHFWDQNCDQVCGNKDNWALKFWHLHNPPQHGNKRTAVNPKAKSKSLPNHKVPRIRLSNVFLLFPYNFRKRKPGDRLGTKGAFAVGCFLQAQVEIWVSDGNGEKAEPELSLWRFHSCS